MNGTMQPIPGDCICTCSLYSLFLYSIYPCISRSLLFCVPRYSAFSVVATILSTVAGFSGEDGAGPRRCGQMLHVLMGDLTELSFSAISGGRVFL